MQGTTLDNIVRQIRHSQYKCFDLYLNNFGKEILINSSECDDAEQAVTALHAVIGGFAENNPSETRFSIRLKTTKTANGSGVIGPIPFSINKQGMGAAPAAQNPFDLLTQMQGLGFVSGATHEAQQLVSEAKMKVLLAEAELQRKTDALALERKHFAEDKAREQARLAGLEQKYNSSAEYMKDGFEKAIGAIMHTFMPDLKPSAPLGEVVEDELSKDPRFMPIQALSTRIFEQVKSLDHIANIDLLVTWAIANPTECAEWCNKANQTNTPTE